jgi:hypothetical protein
VPAPSLGVPPVDALVEQGQRDLAGRHTASGGRAGQT